MAFQGGTGIPIGNQSEHLKIGMESLGAKLREI
jgi:hypothetical protein